MKTREELQQTRENLQQLKEKLVGQEESSRKKLIEVEANFSAVKKANEELEVNGFLFLIMTIFGLRLLVSCITNVACVTKTNFH